MGFIIISFLSGASGRKSRELDRKNYFDDFHTKKILSADSLLSQGHAKREVSLAMTPLSESVGMAAQITGWEGCVGWAEV